MEFVSGREKSMFGFAPDLKVQDAGMIAWLGVWSQGWPRAKEVATALYWEREWTQAEEDAKVARARAPWRENPAVDFTIKWG